MHTPIVSSRHYPLIKAAFSLPCLALATVLFAGCGRKVIVNNPPPTVVHQTTAAPAPAAPVSREVIVLKEAPPPPRQESMTSQPSPDHIWIPGYWIAREGRSEWVRGHWDVPPRSGLTWVEPRWERRGEGYVFIEGGWR